MMKMLMMIGLLAGGLIWAQTEGEQRDVDGQIFTYTNGIWMHNLLGESFELNESFISRHEDDLWKDWYRQGTTTLQRILDLGPNVIFRFRGQDGVFRNYASFKCLDIDTQSDDPERTETLDEQNYAEFEDVWVQDGLGPTYTLYTDFTTIYKEQKWEQWADQDEKLERILDLGENIVFQYTDPDQVTYTYFVHNCVVVPAAPVDERPLAVGPLTASIIGGAIVVGTVIIEDNNDDNEESPIRNN